MSKLLTSRSRAEKTRGVVSIVAPVTNDIVPGKFTEHDLNLCLEQENLDEYMFTIVESLYQEMEKKIFEKYLNSRIVPFTVDLAKNAMLKIIEWNFLSHDLGESDRFESVWLEDEEPESCMIDSWAQGYFPKRQASFVMFQNSFVSEDNSKLEDSEEEINESLERISTDFNENDVITVPNTSKDEIIDSEPENKTKTEDISLNSESDKTSSNKIKTKVPFKPYRGKLNFDDLNMLTETLSETEERLEFEQYKKAAKLLRGPSSQSSTSRQTGHVDYEKKVIQKLFGTTVKNYQQLRSGDILLNTNEQLVAMMKIPSEQLIPQRVKANHKTLDAGLSRANLMANKENALKKKNITTDKMNSISTKQDEFRAPVVQNDKHPLPMSMLDSIDPVPGVTVQEGERIKKSTNKKLEKDKQMEKEFLSLRPIKNQSTEAAYMIQDIINVNKVNIKPISSSTPIPPIADGFKIYE